MRVCDGIVLTIGVFAATACAGIDDAPDARPEGSTTTASIVTRVTPRSMTLDDRIAMCTADPRVVAGAVSVDVCVGADLFFRETFGGNGRSCATCHAVDHNFTIDPAFIQQLPASDPLFVAETNPALAQLEIPAVMRQFGLILENVDGFAPDPTTHFVLRSVPHTFSLATSITRAPGDLVNPPVDRTGWSGDGAPGTGALRDFQTGAITQHYTRSLARVAGQDFRLATDGELDRIDAFMHQLGRTNELDLTSVVMTDARADLGRQKFLTVGCNACHNNAGANAGFGGGGNRNFNTGIESSRHVALQGFPADGGFGAAVNAQGTFGNGTFNAPPLIEAADTGPFFHTAVTISGSSAHNVPVATQIEEAIAFYDSPAFNQSPAGLVAPIHLAPDEIDNIGRFLRGLNAAFNAALAGKRLDAIAAIRARFGDQHMDVQLELLRLAQVEANDGARVLSQIATPADDFDGAARAGLQAISRLATLIQQGKYQLTDALLTDLRELPAAIEQNLGSNLSFQIGDGTVMN